MMKGVGMKRSIIAVGLTVCMIFGASAALAKTYTIRATQTFSSTHPWHKGFEKFKEIVEAKAKGQIKVQNYPAGQLSGGNNRTMCEQVQAGTLQLLVQAPPSWAGLAPKSQIYNMPFLFPDGQQALKIARESDVSKKILKEAFDNLGVTVIDIWENGYRNLTSRIKVVHTPDDFKGMKVRVPMTPLLTEVFKTLGALPVSMSMTEVYTSLQQGAVDAQENPISAIFSNKLYEVAPKITLWGYCWDPGIVTINKKFFDDLPADLQAAVMESIAEAGRYVNALVAKEDKELIAEMQKAGAEFYVMTPEESKVFADALKPVYDKFTPELGADLIEGLKQEIAKAAK